MKVTGDVNSEQQSIDWAAGTWTNPPATTRISDEGVLYVTAIEGSDAWRHTSYGFVHNNEHALVTSFSPGTSMEVDFATPFSHQFDQAGIFIYAAEDRWIKAGIEFADGVPQIGAVVTNGKSDWSATKAPDWGNTRVSFRVSWADDAITIRARRAHDDWQLVRLLPFTAQDGVTAGPLVCAPTRAGLEVPFYGWRSGLPDVALH